MRPVTPRSSRSWSGSWSVASTDHTLTDAGSRPASSAPARTSATQRASASSVTKVCRITPSSSPAGPPHRLEAEARGHHRDVGVDAAAEREQRVLPGRAVVAEHRLALPEPPVEPDGVLHLGHRDRRDAHDAEQRRDAPADAEREPAAGELVHRVRPRRGHQRVTRRRVGHAGRDADLLGHRRGRAAQRRRLLHVEPLRQEHRPEPDPLRVAHLVEQHPRVAHVPRQAVAPELHHPFRVRHARRSSRRKPPRLRRPDRPRRDVGVPGGGRCTFPADAGCPRAADRRAAGSGDLRVRRARGARPVAGRGAAGVERHQGVLGGHPARRRVGGVERPRRGSARPRGSSSTRSASPTTRRRR